MMPKPAANPRTWGVSLALLVLLLDQLSKYWVLHILNLDQRLDVPVLDFFNLTMVWNRGVSMGLLQADSAAARWGLVAVTGAIALVVSLWLRRTNFLPEALALGAVLGGALGNIIDRSLYGAVVDFLRLHVGDWSFYVFNIADAAISLGVGLLLLLGLRRGETAPTQNNSHFE